MYHLGTSCLPQRTPGNISMLDVIEKDRYTIHRPKRFFAELSRYWKIWREKWILWGWIYGYDDYLCFPTIYFGMWMKQMQHKKYNFKNTPSVPLEMYHYYNYRILICCSIERDIGGAFITILSQSCCFYCPMAH